ncbi:unnamed protein product [marine sediment metagenome]|uniref:Uncharacterized protein n=1 Tax=marine sediment metagenome TaxID=412755 RepID=X1T342_9ZZZZ
MCLGVLLFTPPGGPGAVIEYAWQQGKFSVGPYDWDFATLTFVVMALNGIFYAIQKYGTDQTIIQRYLTSKSDKEAIKAALMGVNTYVIIWILGISVVVLTMLGGIEAVIWLDVIQGLMLMVGGLLCLGVLLFTPPGGPGAVIEYAWQQASSAWVPTIGTSPP